MKLNGQNIGYSDSSSESLDSVDSFEVSDELVTKVLSENGKEKDSSGYYTVDTKSGSLLKVDDKSEIRVVSAVKTWHGFSELGNFAEVREVYQSRAKLGKNIFYGLIVVTVILCVLAILILIWMEVTYGY